MKKLSITEFIERHIDLIEEQDWWNLYRAVFSEATFSGGVLTNVLHELNIFPEYSACKHMPMEYYSCSDIDRVEVFSNLQTTIEPLTYNECYKLEKAIIPEGITDIKCSAFRGCDNLTEVIFPSTLKSICGDAFRKCTKLRKIKLPKGIRFIDISAFRDCNITEVTYDGTVKQWIREVRISPPRLQETTAKAYERHLMGCPNIVVCKNGQIELKD